MTLAEIEQRLLALERTVAHLQVQQGRSGDLSRRWWVDDAGRFADDPVFDEIVRLGQAYRRSLRPRPRAKRRQP
jgi:hypothetical protein